MEYMWKCEQCGTWLGKVRPVECPKCGSPAYRSIFLHVFDEEQEEQEEELKMEG